MKFKTLALAALAFSSLGAQAALTTYAPWAAYWPTPTGQGQGVDNVLFNVQTASGVTVALGAHAYKNGEFLANDGVSTYYAASGTYTGEPDRANWSFDFAWDLGTACTGCTVKLEVDTDPGAGETFVTLFNTNQFNVAFESWNMEMSFMNGLMGGYDFNPNAATSTGFRLSVLDANSTVLVSSNITVQVPEPASLALVGAALLGLAASRRRRA